MGRDETGMVLDILRGSLHDGPGIRTAVFFKGCPLCCIWCHNPESRSMKPQLGYMQEKCVNCLSCLRVCPNGAHRAAEGRHILRREACTACGRCVAACGRNALRLYGRRMTCSAVFAEVARDMDFYGSDGGVTLTGGEPLFQPAFALGLLKMCREKHIHTCVETSGYAPRAVIERFAGFVDLFLYDYKATAQADHVRLTGRSNAVILKNLDYLCRQGKRIILRCPLVPGVNDTREHLEGIARLSAKYPSLEAVELMPYHNMGVSKGLAVGEDMPLARLANADEKQKSGWLAALEEFGCRKARLG